MRWTTKARLAAVSLTGRIVHMGVTRAVADRWQVITVCRSEEDIAASGGLPAPLADVLDQVDVRLRPAPGGQGTEIAARLRGTPDTDRRQRLRAALHEARQLLETGEILNTATRPVPARDPRNRPVEYVATHGRDEPRR